MINEEQINDFFDEVKKMSSEQFMEIVEKKLDDDLIEVCAANLEELYGIEDDDELGALTQVFISGILLGQSTKEKS